MNDSPTFSRMSASPPGLSWLLSGGTERKQNLAPAAENVQQRSVFAHRNQPGDAQPIQTSNKYSSQTSLLSQSSSNGGSNQYNSMSMSHSASLGRMQRGPSLLRLPSPSSGMLRSSINSSSVRIPPELSYQQLQQPEIMKMQQEPMDILLQSIHSCTANIFGLYGLEIWKFDKESGSLISTPVMPPHALDVKQHRRSLFIKRITQEADYNSSNYNSSAKDAFERLTETTRLDFVSKAATDPGVGVAGALWSESNSNALSTKTLAVVQSGVQSLSETISDKLHLHISSPRRTVKGMAASHFNHENEQVSNRVLWRDINSLAEDPDQPYDERLQLFAKAGFALAAGIPFNVRGFKGIVVFFANPHADMKKLCDNTNSRLIEFAAQFIGSAAAVQTPLQNARLLRTRRPISNWNILRVKILAVIKFQRPIHVRRRGRSRTWGSPTIQRVDSFKLLQRAASIAMIDRKESFKILSEATARLKSDVKKGVVDIQYQSKIKTVKWWKKVQGGHASIPPPFNNYQCAWTFMGVFSTHTVLSRLLSFCPRLPIGPLGALTTLQYNLTAAPARYVVSFILDICYCYVKISHFLSNEIKSTEERFLWSSRCTVHLLSASQNTRSGCLASMHTSPSNRGHSYCTTRTHPSSCRCNIGGILV